MCTRASNASGWPGFARNGKQDVTPLQVLTHVAGIPVADAAPPGESARLERDATDQTLAQLESPNLKSLIINSGRVTDEGIKSLKRFQRLDPP